MKQTIALFLTFMMLTNITACNSKVIENSNASADLEVEADSNAAGNEEEKEKAGESSTVTVKPDKSEDITDNTESDDESGVVEQGNFDELQIEEEYKIEPQDGEQGAGV